MSLTNLSLGLIVAVSAASAAATTLPPRDGGFSVRELNALSMVSASLRDSKSAEFIAVQENGRVVCGSVSARNGYNGMMGPTPFAVVFPQPQAIQSIYSDNIIESVIFGNDEKMRGIVALLCVK